jgi:hypothetical protein
VTVNCRLLSTLPAPVATLRAADVECGRVPNGAGAACAMSNWLPAAMIPAIVTPALTASVTLRRRGVNYMLPIPR